MAAQVALRRQQQQEEDTRYKLIPGLDVDKATDIKYLEALQTEIEAKIRDLTTNQALKFSSKKTKEELQVKKKDDQLLN